MAKSAKKKSANKKSAKKTVQKKSVNKVKAKAKSTARAKSAKSTKTAKTAKSSAPKIKAKPSSKAKTVKPVKPMASKAKAQAERADVTGLFTPLDDRVLVRRIGAADRTPGGLYIPESVSAGDRPTQGKVVAVGRGHRDEKGRLRPLDVRLGDTIMFTSLGGNEVSLEGEDLLCLREEEIIAVVK